MAVKTLKVKFTHERETKRTHRFAEVGDEDQQAIRTLYVQKDQLDEIGYQDGMALEVTVKPVKA